MKKVLFLLSMMLLTSCSTDDLFVRNEQSFGFACFVIVGLAIGSFLGFLYSRMPTVNVVTGARLVEKKKVIPRMLSGALVTGLIFGTVGLYLFYI